MIVGLTGATGNMGKCLMQELVNIPDVDKIKILGNRKKTTEKLLKKFRKYHSKIEVIYGGINNKTCLSSFLNELDYVINMAGVIPPASDQNPKAAISVNQEGPKSLVEMIEKMDKQPKLIHISTVAVYGDRNYHNIFGEVGDPLLPSPFDIYSITKVRGEYAVLESAVKKWAILRQTAVLYDELLFKNVSDGLMFHTCFNAPLEWVSARDSAVLIRNILLKDQNGELDDDNFWLKCFNIGGGEENRITGFDTLDIGFRIIGARCEQFIDTNYNSLRNFHGVWFSDGYKLEELFHYQKETVVGFWKKIARKHPYFGCAKILPKKLLKALVIKRLLNDPNSPTCWVNKKDEARVMAYFGGLDKYQAIPKDWSMFPLLSKNTHPDVKLSLKDLRSKYTYLDHGFDIHKDFREIDIEDLRNVAFLHGGKLLTKDFKKGDIYQKVEWENQDGVVFKAKPYTILGCGHWYNKSYEENVWDYDRLAKKDKIYADVWYSSHDKDEDCYYYYDDDFKAHVEHIKNK